MSHRLTPIFAALTLLAGASPACALDGWVLAAYTELAPPTTPFVPAHPGHLEFLGHQLELEHTGLAEIAALGNAGLHSGRNGESWVCYLIAGDAGRLRLTFVSDHPVAGIEAPLGLVALESGGSDIGCATPSGATALPDMRLPLPGASLAELAAHFGSAVPDSAGRIVYLHEAEAATGLRVQSIRYRIVDGVATDLTLAEVTL